MRANSGPFLLVFSSVSRGEFNKLTLKESEEHTVSFWIQNVAHLDELQVSL